MLAPVTSRGALLLVAAVAAGCRPAAPPAAPETLEIAVQADVTGVYPAMREESFSFDVNSNIFEGLVRPRQDLTAEPALAERWENPDERTWLFRLRPGLRFSDGTPVTATDVAAALTFGQGPRAVARNILSPVESVEALAPDLVRVRTRYPFPVLLRHLTAGFVLPAAALRPPSVAPIGTGPYALESWLPGRELVLVENARYRGPRPAFRRVRLTVMADPAARSAALLAGRAHIADNVPLAQFARLSSSPAVRVVSRPGLRVLFLALRMNEPPFADARVREAFDLALDRDELIRRALDGHGQPAAQLVPAAVLGHNPDLRPTRPDRERARRLLAEAGYGSGLSVRLDGPNNRYVNDGAILLEVARQLALVGVRVEVAARPKEEFFALLDRKVPSFYLFGWSSSTGHAGDALEALMHTPTPNGVGFENVQFLSDPELDRLIDAAHASPRLDERSLLLAGALARVAQLRPVLPLVVQTETLALAREIDWEPPLDMALRLRDVRWSPATARD